MIHFFGLLLDERTARALTTSEFLDTSQVRILQVECLHGARMHFICPRGTIVLGLRSNERTAPRVPYAYTFLKEKCLHHVRITLGSGYHELYVEDDCLKSASLICHEPRANWLMFCQEDVKDLTA